MIRVIREFAVKERWRRKSEFAKDLTDQRSTVNEFLIYVWIEIHGEPEVALRRIVPCGSAVQLGRGAADEDKLS